MRAWLLFVFAFLSCSTGTRAEEAVQASQAMTQLAERGFAGSVLVACGDEVIFGGDYGLAPGGSAPSYWIASISKQFTAAAILQLAEAGRLSLDHPISRFFPEAPRDKASITLAQLMSHRSGLPQTYAADGIDDREAAARAIFAVPLRVEPGTAFTYSNDNYSLLAMVIEVAAAERFEDYVRENLFDRAGMTDAGLWPDARGDYAPPELAPITGPASVANWGFRGGTGMRASVMDLHRWVRALDEERVLTPESVALLYGPHTSARDGDGVGFGWFWSESGGDRWLWTRGSESSGPNAVIYRLWGTPLTIIAATNAGPAESEGSGWSRQARDALMQIFDGSSCG